MTQWNGEHIHQKRANRSRVGSPTTLTLHDKGLSTQIGQEDRDAYGRKIVKTKNTNLRRLRKWDTKQVEFILKIEI